MRSRSRKTVIHVNQHALKANLRSGRDDPAIIVRDYKGRTLCYAVEVLGPSKVIHTPNEPLACGARVWIETNSEVVMTTARPKAKRKK